VKAYAPWCHHCKQLEPTYMQVAQALHSEDVGVHVGRIDCTRFASVATHFSVRGFPTLLFISQERVVEYHGDRTKEEIIDFAKRMKGPKVKPATCEDLDKLLELHKVYFISFGETIPGPTLDALEDFYALNWFYHSSTICPGFSEGLYAIKGTPNRRIEILHDPSATEIAPWIKQQRFPLFVKVTYGNFNMLLNSGKTLAIALVQEYSSVGKLANESHDELKDLLEDLSGSYKDKELFSFGWCSQLEMINSIAIQTIEPPKFVIVDSRSLQYFVLEEETTRENLVKALDDLVLGNLYMIGGDSYYHKALRSIYDGFTSLTSMYKGNPILTLLLLGLPMSFLSIIVYTSCCTDILDAREEDEEEEPIDLDQEPQHAKTE